MDLRSQSPSFDRGFCASRLSERRFSFLLDSPDDENHPGHTVEAVDALLVRTDEMAVELATQYPQHFVDPAEVYKFFPKNIYLGPPNV